MLPIHWSLRPLGGLLPALVLAILRPVEAQSADPLRLGAAAIGPLGQRVQGAGLVRVRTGDSWRLVRSAQLETTLLVGLGEAIDLSQVDEIQEPGRATARGLIIGSLFGGTVGAVAGVVISGALSQSCLSPFGCGGPSRDMSGKAAVWLGVRGLVAGGLIGTLIGSQTRRWSQLYRRAPLTPLVEASPAGGIRLGLRLALARP